MSYELTRWIGMSAELERRIEESSGELTEAIELMLKHVDLSLPAAVDNAKLFMERIETVSKEWRERARQVQAVARGLENAQDRVKANIKAAMQAAGVSELKGKQYRMVLSNAAPKLVIDEAQLAAEFKTPIVEMVADKELIRKSLDAGEIVPGATLEQVHTLRTYFKKGPK